MFPTADQGNPVLAMLAISGTLILLLLFAIELIRNRRLAKRKRDLAKMWFK